MSTETPETTFDIDVWVDAVMKASSSLEVTSQDVAPNSTDTSSAVVHFKLGRSLSAILVVEAGRITGSGEKAEVSLAIPVTAEQLEEYCSGARSMSRDYMRGDLKPVGPTGHFIAVLDVFENPDFVAALVN